ncbi:MAG: ABC transporter ATP-binding protein [Nitriliruptoraceae bacterium]
MPNITVQLNQVNVTYRVYEDRRPRLRDRLTGGGSRPAFRSIHAVKDVSLTAYEKDVVGVIGRNGSGKSTLMKALAGLLPVSSGDVFATAQPTLLGVSAVLRPNLSGRRNIILGGLALGLTRAQIDAKTPEIIAFTGLNDFIDLPMRTYSSGMRARLHFAVATAVEPDILIVDEALSVGDEEFKRKSQERIEGMRSKAGTVFIVSHSLSTITQLCNRAIWLDKGVVVADGDTETVVNDYRTLANQGR